MKKVIAMIGLGTLLMAGFFFADNQPTDTAQDLEPTVFSMNMTEPGFSLF